MAIPTATARSKVASTTAASSYTCTTTWTPGANSLLLAAVVGTLASSPTDPSSVTGHGVTYTKLGTSYDVGTTHKFGIYYADAGASPTSTAVTATWGSNRTGGAIIEYEVSGADLSGGVANAIIQNPTNSGTATSGTVTFSSQSNAFTNQITFWLHLANEVTDPRSNWTETATYGDGNFTNPGTGLEGQHRQDGTFETTGSASWSTSSAWRGFGLEIRGAGELTCPTISAGNQLYDQAVTAGAVTIILASYIATSVQLYDPGVSPGAVTLTLPTISSTAQLYDQTVELGAQTLILPTISSGSQLYEPTIPCATIVVSEGATTRVTRDKYFISGTETSYAIDFTTDERNSFTSFSDIRVSVTANGNRVTVYWLEVKAPESATQTITLPTISSTEQLYNQAVQGVLTLILPTISATSELYDQSVSPGAVTLTLPTIASTEQLYNQAVSAGSMELILPTIATTVQLYNQGVSAGAVTITLPTLPTGSQLYDPGVSPGAVTLTLPYIATTVELYNQSVTAGAVTLTLPTIDAGNQLYDQSVSHYISGLEPPTIPSGSELFTGAVFKGVLVVVKEAATTRVVRDVSDTSSFANYALDFTTAERNSFTSWSDIQVSTTAQGKQTTIAWLELKAPESSLQSLTLPTIASTSQLYAGSVDNAPIYVTVAFKHEGVTIFSTQVALTSSYALNELDLSSAYYANVDNPADLDVAVTAQSLQTFVSWFLLTAPGSIPIEAPTIGSSAQLFNQAVRSDYSTHLEELVLSSTGVCPIVATLSRVLRTDLLSSTGTVLANLSGTLDITLGALTLSSNVAVPIVGALGSTLDNLVLSSGIQLGLTGDLAITLDDLDIVASGNVPTGGVLPTFLKEKTILPGITAWS